MVDRDMTVGKIRKDKNEPRFTANLGISSTIDRLLPETVADGVDKIENSEGSPVDILTRFCEKQQGILQIFWRFLYFSEPRKGQRNFAIFANELTSGKAV